ncbi:Cyclin-D3-2 [Platanthera zijinensis]|uniref:Cyclin-D3-2 n=1 Tax=Platanthera zijinensis TaxID=2320716 RepID=A0AAP0C3K6_9ASPA
MDGMACCTLAAKVEKTRVSLLLDLQLPPPTMEMGCVFENRTTRRMKLLIMLLTLWWRMNPVPPLSPTRRHLLKIPAMTGNWFFGLRLSTEKEALFEILRCE